MLAGIEQALHGGEAPNEETAALAALMREAALRAASRASADGQSPKLKQEDLLGALTVIRPLSRSGSEEINVGSVTLADVGDMAEAKQALTEAVLWPLQHPDTFSRLGVDPPRGVLLYGPPGCGKTFVVRALASTGKHRHASPTTSAFTCAPPTTPCAAAPAPGRTRAPRDQ